MPYRESETVELKSVVVDDIKKEIIAFANTDGGTLYIGVKDDGEVIGLDDPDGSALQVSNMVRDSIKPDTRGHRWHCRSSRSAMRSMFSVAQTVRITLPKRECAQKVFTSGRAIPLYQPLIPPFAA